MVITDVVVIYDDPEQLSRINSIPSDKGLYFTSFNYKSRKGKKKAWEQMEEWGARKLPFIILKDHDEVVKCLYSEAEDDIIETLKSYL